MFIFINPWASYDPDDIPTIYSGDSEYDTKVMWSVIYVIILSIIYLVGSSYLLLDLFFDYIKNNFVLNAIGIFGCIGIYVALMIIGINKILK